MQIAIILTTVVAASRVAEAAIDLLQTQLSHRLTP